MKLILKLMVLVMLASCPQNLTIAAEPEGWKANPELVEKRSNGDTNNNGGRTFIYREKEVPDYQLPAVLKGADGKEISSSDEWEKSRRHEILELFRSHVYGRAPLGRPQDMTFEVYDVDRTAMDGAATRKQVKIHLKNGEKELAANAIIFIPNKPEKPVPAFLLICNREKDNIDPTRQNKSEFWPAEELIARGYAAVAFHNADFDPDNYDEFKDGVHGLYDGPQPRAEDAWGTIAAWAWGASRVLDYLETDTRIDSSKVAIIGHSRGGKTALWAGAEDERFALVISNNSGCGGAALSRRQYGETVGRINRAFPHWFCKKFSEYNEHEANLPVDQHMLIALCAPRLVYVASADEDLWADPRGEFLSALAANPVFALYGLKGVTAESMPAMGKPVQDGQIGYHVRSGGHNLSEYDWQRYMDFADRHWKK
ncbi:MAG: acetylxylan esterase [Planctomycetaceae bacterium]|nr:acetylxylan esterase [Planctomycetaceae bacterium]